MRGEKELHDAILELHVCALADFSSWTRAQKIAGRTKREFLRESLTLLIISKNLKKYESPDFDRCHRFTVHNGSRQCGRRRNQRGAINDELQSALV